MAVLFGPNAAGKSNLLDAIQAFCAHRHAAHARGRAGGADPRLSDRGVLVPFGRAWPSCFRRRPRVLRSRRTSSAGERLLPVSGQRGDAPRVLVLLDVADEYLSALGQGAEPKGTAAIELVERADPACVARAIQGSRATRALGRTTRCSRTPGSAAPEYRGDRTHAIRAVGLANLLSRPPRRHAHGAAAVRGAGHRRARR